MVPLWFVSLLCQNSDWLRVKGFFPPPKWDRQSAAEHFYEEESDTREQESSMEMEACGLMWCSSSQMKK